VGGGSLGRSIFLHGEDGGREEREEGEEDVGGGEALSDEMDRPSLSDHSVATHKP